jgi:hypothetical protein
MLPSRLQDDAAELQRYFQVSPKLLELEKLALVS